MSEPMVRSKLDGSVLLTKRQVEMVGLLACGHNIREAAVALGLSVHTAAGHSKAVMRRLGAKNRAELVLLAVRHGFIRVPTHPVS